jgi:O-antigen/teichoic acid export membrane protein
MKSSVRGAVLTSLIIQGIGTASPLATVIVIARLSGPRNQAIFSSFKSWMDLVSSIAVFGFPQAFVYILNKKLANTDNLLNFSIFYAAATSAIIFPLAMYSVYSGYNIPPENQNVFIYSVMLTCGVCSIIFHRLVRAIYLTVDDGFKFSIITIAPAFFLLLAMTCALAFPKFHYDIAFFVSGIFTILSALYWVRRLISRLSTYKFKIASLPKRALASQSIHAFAQSVTFTLQPVITIKLLHVYGVKLDGVAFFTSSVIMITAVNAVFSIISPILFNRWTAHMDSELMRRLLKSSHQIAAIFIPVSIFSFFADIEVIPFVFGKNYESAIWTFQIVSLAMAAVAFTRMISPAIHAAGRPDLNTVSCAVRLTASVGIQVALSKAGMMSPLAAAVCAWAIAEWLAALYSSFSGFTMLRGLDG